MYAKTTICSKLKLLFALKLDILTWQSVGCNSLLEQVNKGRSRNCSSGLSINHIYYSFLRLVWIVKSAMKVQFDTFISQVNKQLANNACVQDSSWYST